jgi:hypothetical protein
MKNLKDFQQFNENYIRVPDYESDVKNDVKNIMDNFLSGGYDERYGGYDELLQGTYRSKTFVDPDNRNISTHIELRLKASDRKMLNDELGLDDEKGMYLASEPLRDYLRDRKPEGLTHLSVLWEALYDKRGKVTLEYS